MDRFGRSFSMGKTGPYQLLLLPKDSDTVYEQEFWTEATALLEELVAKNYQGESKRYGTLASPMFSYNVDGKQSEVVVGMNQSDFLDPKRHDASMCEYLVSMPKLRSSCKDFVRTKNCSSIAPP